MCEEQPPPQLLFAFPQYPKVRCSETEKVVEVEIKDVITPPTPFGKKKKNLFW